jgi:O-antigen/teichoic acid export membrane protein
MMAMTAPDREKRSKSAGLEHGEVVDRVAVAARSNVAFVPLLAGAGLASTIVLAAILGPSEFAVYALAVAIKGSIDFLADLGTGTASQRMFAVFHARRVRHQAIALYLRLLAARGIAGAALVVAVIALPDLLTEALGLRPPERFILYFAAPIGIVEMTATLASYVLSATLNQPTSNRVTFAFGLLQPAVVTGVAVAGLGLEGIVIALLATSVLRAASLNYFALRVIRDMDVGGVAVDRPLRVFSRVAVGSVIGKVASWVNSQQFLMLVVIAAYPRPEVAAFAIAWNLTLQILVLVSNPLTGLLVPVFSARSDDRARIHALFRRSTRLLALIVLPVAGLAAVGLPPFADLAFDPSYTNLAVFAVVLVTGLAAEKVLLSPATALMLSQDALLRPYAVVGAFTVALAGAYFALLSQPLLTVVLVLVGIRLGSATALHLAIWRSWHWRVELGWLARLGLVVLVAIAAGSVVQLGIGSDVLSLAAGLAAAAGVMAIELRFGRLVQGSDVDAARRAVPGAAAVLLRFGQRGRRRAERWKSIVS